MNVIAIQNQTYWDGFGPVFWTEKVWIPVSYQMPPPFCFALIEKPSLVFLGAISFALNRDKNVVLPHMGMSCFWMFGFRMSRISYVQHSNVRYSYTLPLCNIELLPFIKYVPWFFKYASGSITNQTDSCHLRNCFLNFFDETIQKREN